MTLLYSKDELELKKYTELQQIVKKLGYKGRKLKTEKLIAFILESQGVESSSSSESFSEDLLAEGAQVAALLVEEETSALNKSDDSLINVDDIFNTSDPFATSVKGSPAANHSKIVTPTNKDGSPSTKKSTSKKRKLSHAGLEEKSAKKSRRSISQPIDLVVQSRKSAFATPVISTKDKNQITQRGRKANTDKLLSVAEIKATSPAHIASRKILTPKRNASLRKSLLLKNAINSPKVTESVKSNNNKKEIIQSENDASKSPKMTAKICKSVQPKKSKVVKSPKQSLSSNATVVDGVPPTPTITPPTPTSVHDSPTLTPSSNTLAVPTESPSTPKNIFSCIEGVKPLSSQAKRISIARRLSSPMPRKRVIPTYAQPVKVDNRTKKSDDKTQDEAKSSIPRFMAYAQKIKKMPDFKKIHAKAFGNMENVGDFLIKKAQATPLDRLKSNNRPSASFSPSVTSTKAMKLNFADKTGETPIKFTAKRTESPAKPAKTPAKPAKTPVKQAMTPRNKPLNASLMKSVNRLSVRRSPLRKSKVTKKQTEDVLVKKNVTVKKDVSVKENIKPVADLPPKGSKLPLRVKGATVKRQGLKEMTVKTQENRRKKAHEYVKGVRTNKRFQLQMERRNMQN